MHMDCYTLYERQVLHSGRRSNTLNKRNSIFHCRSRAIGFRLRELLTFPSNEKKVTCTSCISLTLIACINRCIDLPESIPRCAPCLEEYPSVAASKFLPLLARRRNRCSPALSLYSLKCGVFIVKQCLG